MYIDETGIDDNETYDYAWGPKGPRIYGKKKAERKKRMSIISALNKNSLQASFVFQGSCNRDVFEIYLEKVLVPTLHPGQIVVLDNASFHKGGRIRELIETAGCFLQYLPAYSPDFNPIEHWWAAVKNNIRRYLPDFDNDLFKTAEYVFNVSYAS